MVRLDEEKLAGVDESAPSDQFMTEKSPAQHTQDDVGSGAQHKDTNGAVKSGEQPYAEGKQEAQEGVDVAQNGSSDEDKKQGFMDKVREMRVYPPSCPY